MSIAEKVHCGERLSFEEGVELYRMNDIVALGRLANHVREQLNGNFTYYNVNRHINYTNVCVIDCQLCQGAYARKPGEDGGYTMQLAEVFRFAEREYSDSLTEFHIVGGLNPELPLDYYLDLLRGLKSRFPSVHLKAFTMVELDFFAKITRKPLEWVINQLRDAGLGSCPGGGAEIFAERARPLIAGHKIRSEEHTSELQSRLHLVCRLLLEKKIIAVCAQCHMQSAIRNPGPDGELNYVSSGEFFGNRLRQPFGEFSRKGFYKDGRLRQTTFIVEALERSQCFKKAELSCGTCHDPHSRDSASNPTSLKFRDEPDLMCTGCHRQFRDAAAISQHSHHAAESEGSRCVSCHMPRIMDALLFRARYHQIDDIPNAEMTKRFGPEESPNACLLCHTEKNAGWAGQQLSAWKPLRANAR